MNKQEEQEQADINLWAVFGGKEQMEKRQKELLEELWIY